MESTIRFEDLELKTELGRGLFGVVYLAEYLGTQVAVKEVFRIPGVEFAKYFAREVDGLREARHPNCIQFMGIARDEPGNRDFIVTEFVPGGNLSDNWIHDESRELPWRLRVSFATDIARALAYLHAREMIHRDLKGKNLLVTENKRIKVCDFGLSRIRARTADERKRMSYCGTDAYMAPEIMLCMDLDSAVDIFSYGIILLELITRHPADRYQRIIPGFGVDTALLAPYTPDDTPPALWSLACKCVEPEPADRPGWREILGTLAGIEVALVAEAAAALHSASASRRSSAVVNYDRPARRATDETSEGSVAGAAGGAEDEGGEEVPVPPLHLGAEMVDRLAANARSPSEPLLHLGHSESVADDLESLSTLASSSVPASATSPSPSPAAATGSNGTLEAPLSPASPDDDGEPPVVPHRFSLLMPPSMDKCKMCKKRFGMHRRLVCDDCGYACHRKCAALVPPLCALKGGIKAYHERYLEDLMRRKPAEGSLAKSPPGVVSPTGGSRNKLAGV
ncbi:hypothetical protein H9P43_006096 [Blastocladiella emersonii ATCC 22665]|nr:hypothetical protein H9P43_006096 [Blastocladiella emersonii ATCC 22665]